jgi:hypothetical protein
VYLTEIFGLNKAVISATKISGFSACITQSIVQLLVCSQHLVGQILFALLSLSSLL